MCSCNDQRKRQVMDPKDPQAIFTGIEQQKQPQLGLCFRELMMCIHHKQTHLICTG